MSRQLEQRIQALEDQVVRLQEALRNLVRTATVKSYDPERDRVIAADEAEGDEGNGVARTPMIRVASQAGAVSKRTTLSEGEQVVIISPGGEFGAGSIAFPLGPNEANASPSSHGEEDLTTIGETSFRLRGQSAEVTSARVDLGAPGGPAVAREGDLVLVARGSSAGLWPIVTAATKTFAT